MWVKGERPALLRSPPHCGGDQDIPVSTWEPTTYHTEKELHLTQVLPVGPLVALHIEQRVPMVENFGPWRTQWIICCLTVPGHKEAVVHRWGAWGTHGSGQPIGARWTRKPSRTCRRQTNGLDTIQSPPKPPEPVSKELPLPTSGMPDLTQTLREE